MKRIIYILMAVMTVVALLGGVTAFADESTDNLTRGTVYSESIVEFIAPEYEITAANGTNAAQNENESDANVDDSAQNDDSAANGEETNADKTTHEAGADNAREAENSESVNPFEAIFLTVKEYATEIFCALSFVGSVLLAYAYKKGLLPIIKTGIGAISATVSSIKESAEIAESKADDLSHGLSERLAGAETCLGEIEGAMDTLATRLDALQSDSDDRRKIKIILAAQIDMLYSIFMTSSLPQYQKDEVGVKIAEMREALLENENE